MRGSLLLPQAAPGRRWGPLRVALASSGWRGGARASARASAWRGLFSRRGQRLTCSPRLGTSTTPAAGHWRPPRARGPQLGPVRQLAGAQWELQLGAKSRHRPLRVRVRQRAGGRVRPEHDGDRPRHLLACSVSGHRCQPSGMTAAARYSQTGRPSGPQSSGGAAHLAPADWCVRPTTNSGIADRWCSRRRLERVSHR